MYRKYFGIRKLPFSIAPDPRYLYMSERHREALAHLLYGIRNNVGFVLLTGEVGAGKTTICRRLLQRLPKNCDFAYVINPKLSSEELLATICDEFGISYPKRSASIKLLVDRLNAYLLKSFADRRRALLIIDEAQNLSNDVLEQIRLLTNLETNERKLLQIVLIGQPELREKLARPELRQLAQRIVARYHLGPLSKHEVPAYVKHRLRIAGTKEELFSQRGLDRLHSLSGGIPRLINTICDRALLGAYARERKQVDRVMLDEAAGEVLGRPFPSAVLHRKKTALLAAGIVFLVGAIAALLIYFPKLSFVSSVMWEAGIGTGKSSIFHPIPKPPKVEVAEPVDSTISQASSASGGEQSPEGQTAEPVGPPPSVPEGGGEQ